MTARDYIGPDEYGNTAPLRCPYCGLPTFYDGDDYVHAVTRNPEQGCFNMSAKDESDREHPLLKERHEMMSISVADWAQSLTNRDFWYETIVPRVRAFAAASGCYVMALDPIGNHVIGIHPKDEP